MFYTCGDQFSEPQDGPQGHYRLEVPPPAVDSGHLEGLKKYESWPIIGNQTPRMTKMNRKLKTTKISITGDLGSGKSLIGKRLAEKTGFKFYSTGSIQREIASRHGMTTLQLNELSESNFKYDREIDDFTRKLSESSDPFVIDSRLAWYFIPNSFKIYLKVDVDIAAKRIFSDKSRPTEKYPDLASAKKDIIRRKKSELYRFKKYYQVQCGDMNHYDLVIDTSDSTPEEIVETILSHLSAPA
jgi:CMP/dCMP kinase